MRKTISLGLSIVMFVSLFTFLGCKKGENDPFMSLLSRKARITGVWELVEADYDHVYSDGTYNYGFNGSTMTVTASGGSYTYTYSEVVTINKDGTFEIETSETWPDGGGTYTMHAEGAWYFLDGSKELEVKNKERVEFIPTKVTLTGPGSTDNMTFEGNSISDWSDRSVMIVLIDRLANKEMISLLDAVETFDGERYEESGTKTYENTK